MSKDELVSNLTNIHESRKSDLEFYKGVLDLFRYYDKDNPGIDLYIKMLNYNYITTWEIIEYVITDFDDLKEMKKFVDGVEESGLYRVVYTTDKRKLTNIDRLKLYIDCLECIAENVKEE